MGTLHNTTPKRSRLIQLDRCVSSSKLTESQPGDHKIHMIQNSSSNLREFKVEVRGRIPCLWRIHQVSYGLPRHFIRIYYLQPLARTDITSSELSKLSIFCLSILYYTLPCIGNKTYGRICLICLDKGEIIDGLCTHQRIHNLQCDPLAISSTHDPNTR